MAPHIWDHQSCVDWYDTCFILYKVNNISYCSVQCGFGHSGVQGVCYLHCNSCSNALSKYLGKQTLFLSKLQRSIIVLSPKGAVVVFGSYSSWSSEKGSKYFCASTPMNFAFVLLIIHWVCQHWSWNWINITYYKCSGRPWRLSCCASAAVAPL